QPLDIAGIDGVGPFAQDNGIARTIGHFANLHEATESKRTAEARRQRIDRSCSATMRIQNRICQAHRIVPLVLKLRSRVVVVAQTFGCRRTNERGQTRRPWWIVSKVAWWTKGKRWRIVPNGIPGRCNLIVKISLFNKGQQTYKTTNRLLVTARIGVS